MKAGGYGTAGWAIGGDIIIDVCKLVEVDIEPPNENGSFTSLKYVAPANSKGKQAAPSDISSGKRRREDDAELRRYDLASRAVATFLRGPGGPSGTFNDGPSPGVRRRVDTEPPSTLTVPALGREVSIESDSNSSSSEVYSGSSQSTVGTSPSPPRSFAPRDADPFGYLDTKPAFPPAPPANTMQSTFVPPSMLRPWGPNFHGPRAYGTQNLVASQAEPVYPHAFVTFGAGMRQKEIDTYTAQHKLEARHLTGTGEGIPYHVPL